MIVALIALMLMPLAVILNGWYIATLWAWLIVPSFGAPALSVPVAIGVALVANAIHPQTHDDKFKDKSDEAQLFLVVVTALVRVAIGLLVASILRGYIGGAQ